jgi:Trypsin
VIATGWGTTGYASQQSEELLKVELDVIAESHCNLLLREKLSLTNDKLVDNSQLCAGVLQGGRDTCGGEFVFS